MKSFYQQTKKPTGAASILVTIILSIIVVGMIAGITLLSNQENRQASNTDQSNRALNTAQSRVQTLADQLKTDPTLNQTTCQQEDLSSSTGQDAAITCATVTTVAGEQTGQVNTDKTIQVDLGHTEDNNPSDIISQIKLDWGLKGADSDWSALPSAPSPYFPVSADYGARPATLELTFVWYGTKGSPNQFQSGDFIGGSLPMKTIVISPDAAHCNSASTGYQCSLSDTLANLTGVTGVENKNVIMRITARYADTRYSLSFLNSSGNSVDTHLSQAIIDVTARSGQTYRRIQATKPIDYTTFDFAANVLYSGKDICKNLTVYSNHEGAKEGDPNAGKNVCS